MINNSAEACRFVCSLEEKHRQHLRKLSPLSLCLEEASELFSQNGTFKYIFLFVGVNEGRAENISRADYKAAITAGSD